MSKIALLAVLLMPLATRYAPAPPLGCQPLSAPVGYLTLPAEVRIDSIDIVRANSELIEVSMDEFPEYGAWASRDFGRHWQRTKPKFGVRDLVGVSGASGASRSAVLYVWPWAAGSATPSRSFDGGSSWQAVAVRVAGVNHPGARVQVGITGVAGSGKTLYGSVSLIRNESADRPGAEPFWLHLPGVYISNDYGDNWTLFSTDLLYDSPVAANDSDPMMIFGVSANGLVRSTDGGKTWHAVGQQKELAAPIRLRGREAGMRELKEGGVPVPDRLSRGWDVEFYRIEVVGKEHAVLASDIQSRSVCQPRPGKFMVHFRGGWEGDRRHQRDGCFSLQPRRHLRQCCRAADRPRFLARVEGACGTVRLPRRRPPFRVDL